MCESGTWRRPGKRKGKGSDDRNYLDDVRVTETYVSLLSLNFSRLSGYEIIVIILVPRNARLKDNSSGSLISEGTRHEISIARLFTRWLSPKRFRRCKQTPSHRRGFWNPIGPIEPTDAGRSQVPSEADETRRRREYEMNANPLLTPAGIGLRARLAGISSDAFERYFYTGP